MNRFQKEIMKKIENEVRRKLEEKNSYRKKVKTIIERNFKKLFYRVFSSPEVSIKKYDGNSRFGCDEFGRDVEDGLRKYIAILKSRNIKIHTLIVLGSRAKGSWTPKSDIDITIIMETPMKKGKNFVSKRLFHLIERFILSDRPLYLGIELSGCCSKEEFLKRLRSFDLQALDAVVYGKIIYDDGFWKIVRLEYEKIKRKFGLDDLSLKELLFPV